MKPSSTLSNTESRLIAQSIDGDMKSFAILYNRYLNQVFNFVYYRTGSIQKTEIITENIFLKMFERLPEYSKKGNGKHFLAWVFSIASQETGQYTRNHPGVKNTAPDDYLNEEQKAIVVALRSLDYRSYYLIVLRFLNGFTVQDTANILEIGERAFQDLQVKALKDLDKSVKKVAITSSSVPAALSKCLDDFQVGMLTPQECLDRYPELRMSLSPLIRVASQITYLPYISPSDEYQKESRARMIRRARNSKRLGKNKQTGNFLPILFSKAPAFAATLVMLLAAYFGGNQVAYAATASLPGDSLYSLKTTFENAQLYLADDAQDVLLHMEFAEMRLVEVQQLTHLNRYGYIGQAVEGFEQHMESAYAGLEAVVQQDPVIGNTVAELVAEKSTANMSVLYSLAATVPGESQSFIQQALLTTVQLGNPQGNPISAPGLENVPPVSISEEADPDGLSGPEGESAPGQAGNPDDPGNSGANNGAGAPDGPGNSENAGNPPDGPGNSENAGSPPDGPGNSENAGSPPDGPGNSENAGSPPDNPGANGNNGNNNDDGDKGKGNDDKEKANENEKGNGK